MAPLLKHSFKIRCLICRATSCEKLLKTSSSSALLCDENESETVGTSIESRHEMYNNWAKSCIDSITRILKIPKVNSNFLNSSYCQDCLQLLRDVNFTLIQLDNFQNKIIELRHELFGKLRTNYDAVRNKDKMKSNYMDMGHLNISKDEFTCDEIIKMVYEKIEQDIQDWTEYDLIKSIDNHPKIPGIIQDTQGLSNIEQTMFIKYEQESNEFEGNNANTDSNLSVKSTSIHDGQDEQLSEGNYDNTHNEIVNGNVRIRCPHNTCTGRFVNKNLLLVHQRKVHEGDPKPHHCELCESKYKSSSSLYIHRRKHRTDKKSICTKCGRSYTTKYSLDQHMIRIHNQKRRMCSFCDMKFENDEELLVHENIHKTNEQPFKCTTCNVSFTNSLDLKKHSRSHTQLNYICNICGISVLTESNLKIHSKIHDTNYVGHKCEVCSHVFPTKNALEKHMPKHSDDKKFICDVCGSSFKYNCGLIVHFRRHSGILPFVCKICGKGFTLSHCLKNHEEIHSGTYYECHLCHKQFGTKNNLKQHLRTHKPKDPNAKKRIRNKK